MSWGRAEGDVPQRLGEFCLGPRKVRFRTRSLNREKSSCNHRRVLRRSWVLLLLGPPPRMDLPCPGSVVKDQDLTPPASEVRREPGRVRFFCHGDSPSAPRGHGRSGVINEKRSPVPQPVSDLCRNRSLLSQLTPVSPPYPDPEGGSPLP